MLVLTAPRGAATAAAGIYAVCVATLFGTSALYHRINWRTDGARRWMRRLDHSAIFLLIAGSYTPFAILVIDGTMAQVITAVVWGGALLGILLKLVWIDAPKWLAALAYVLLGWVSVVVMPEMMSDLGITATALVAGGGLLYTVGAVIYALRRPDPSPTVFGYHEIFHLLVIAAAGLAVRGHRVLGTARAAEAGPWGELGAVVALIGAWPHHRDNGSIRPVSGT